MMEDMQNTPLTVSDDGTIRVKGSRVTLDVIVRQFKQGATAEQILEDFPALNLRDVYGTIYYYLDHEEEVEEYLTKQKDAADEIRKFIESKIDSKMLRERIRTKRKQLVNK
ncbi:MAG TPA: DUF433 domain-containing protein [Pyrinomonadaceae bacterium]